MADKVSEQMLDLGTELQSTLARLNALIENRNAWADGVDGCREAVALLGRARKRLHEIKEEALDLESNLKSARDELERWSKIHAELATVERDLRAQCEQTRKSLAELTSAERELRADHEKTQTLFKQQSASLANARALAEEMIREIGP